VSERAARAGLDLRERELAAAYHGACPCAAGVKLFERAARGGLDLRERELAAAWRGACPCANGVKLFERAAGGGLDLRERELAAARLYARAGVELYERAAGGGLDLCERELAAAWLYARAGVELYERAAGGGLDLRERELAAAWLYARAGVELSDHAAWSRLDLRERELAAARCRASLTSAGASSRTRAVVLHNCATRGRLVLRQWWLGAAEFAIRTGWGVRGSSAGSRLGLHRHRRVGAPGSPARKWRRRRLIFPEGLRPSDSPTGSLAGAPRPAPLTRAHSLALVRAVCEIAS
jgi:hypothetical protein